MQGRRGLLVLALQLPLLAEVASPLPPPSPPMSNLDLRHPLLLHVVVRGCLVSDRLRALWPASPAVIAAYATAAARAPVTHSRLPSTAAYIPQVPAPLLLHAQADG